MNFFFNIKNYWLEFFKLLKETIDDFTNKDQKMTLNKNNNNIFGLLLFYVTSFLIFCFLQFFYGYFITLLLIPILFTIFLIILVIVNVTFKFIYVTSAYTSFVTMIYTMLFFYLDYQYLIVNKESLITK